MKAMPRLCLIILPRTSTDAGSSAALSAKWQSRVRTGRRPRRLSTAATTRPGPVFDLIMSASSRDDGVLYLQVKFHTPPAEITGAGGGAERLHPGMLFAERGGRFTVLRLPEMMDDTIQIMLNQSHDIVQAVRDPETEFFIR